MGTARERLFQALETILSENSSEPGKFALKRLLKAYRVQAKPGERTSVAHTARDVLYNSIVAAWEGNKLSADQIYKLIEPFRMQAKLGLGRGSKRERAEKSEDGVALDAPETNSKILRKETYKKIENAYFADRERKGSVKTFDSAIAGGPEKKNLNRGQCPKCKSLGIVLAQDYDGENYHSCVYCGFYLSPDTNAKFDLPHASKVLDDALGGFNPEGEE